MVWQDCRTQPVTSRGWTILTAECGWTSDMRHVGSRASHRKDLSKICNPAMTFSFCEVLTVAKTTFNREFREDIFYISVVFLAPTVSARV